METQVLSRKPYPTDVSEDEWAFVAPYLSLMTPDAPQRRHDLREVFNALRWIVHTGAPWRYLPGDLPPWEAVYQQTRRWLEAGCFEAMVHDLRALLRWADGRHAQPTAVIFDSATRQSTPESGHRAGYDGYKRRKGSKIQAAVDTLAAGVICFAALGVALSHAIPNSESAPAYVNAVFLPMIMLAGVFYDDEDAPAVLRDLAEAMPLKHLIDGLSGAMVNGEGLADHGVALAALCVWAAAGVLLAVRGFTWDARRD